MPDGALAQDAFTRSGSGVVVARASGGRTVLTSTLAESPLRLVRPTFPGTRSAAVCVVTFGGGLVDGDDIALELDVGPGATLVVFSQASTKVFRGAARQTLRARVAGTLVLLPDLVSAFADARYTQRVDVELAGPDAACVLLDGFTSGRAAFGERWAMRGLDLRTSVTIADRAIVVDALRLDTADGPIPARTGPFEAFATLVAVGHAAAPVVQAIERDPIAPPSPGLVVAASPLPRARSVGLPGAVLRAAATSPHDALAAVRARLRNLGDMDVVDPFRTRY